MLPEPTEGTCRIPFYNRRGIAGYTLVDPDDFERFHDWRWHLKNGYLSHQKQHGGNANAVHTRTYLHRAVLDLKQGDGWIVDHINRDKLDNRKANLRICDQSVNMRNSERHPETATGSGFRNVYWNERRQLWAVSARFGGERFFHKHYRTKDEAIAVAHAVKFCLDAQEPKAVGS